MISPAVKSVIAGYVDMIAAVNGWPAVSEVYVQAALQKVEDGEEECERSPSGNPELKTIYHLAVQLESQALTKQ